MANEIQLLKNNDKRYCSDLEWMDEFYRFLQGETPTNRNDGKPVIKLSANKAFSVIMYLQEQLPIFPDDIEKCSVCASLYDTGKQGHYSELTSKFYCSESCEPPDLYEREKKAGLD